MITVYYWPDGCWFYADQRSQFTHRSDDFITLQKAATDISKENTDGNQD